MIIDDDVFVDMGRGDGGINGDGCDDDVDDDGGRDGSNGDGDSDDICGEDVVADGNSDAICGVDADDGGCFLCTVDGVGDGRVSHGADVDDGTGADGDDGDDCDSLL